MNQSIITLGNFVLFAIVPPVNLFVLFYLIRSNWRATSPGRALMHSKISLLLLVDISAVTAFLGSDFPGREWVRLVVFAYIAFSQWRLFVILLQVQNTFSRSTETSEETHDRLEKEQGFSDSLKVVDYGEKSNLQ